MKFNKKIMCALLLAPAALLAACGGSDNSSDKGGTAGSSQAGTTGESVTIWVSETEGVSTSFKALAEAWAKENNYDYTFNVVGITEAESATTMLTDVAAGADIYCFAQDQFARLVQGGALAKLGTKAATFVTDNNTVDSARACKSGDDFYAYPLTADNGYFMYYDKSVITDESHLSSLEDLVKDCEDAGKKFSMEMGTSAWYLGGFFMAYDENNTQLCHSNWTTDDAGKFIGVDDTYNSANGIIACKGIQHLVKSEAHESSSKAADFTAATPSAVLVSGTWAYNDVKAALGDNMGVAELPYYTVDGHKYHIGSYSGYKLMGVKPQSDATRASRLNSLVQYFTSYDAEVSRLKDFGWGPSNSKAQQTDDFKNNPALAALANQNRYATAQGQIHGSWWDIAKVIGTSLEDVDQDDEVGIQAVLDTYKKAIDATLTMTDDVKRAFTIQGKIASENTNWDTDIAMTEDPTNTWTSKPITLAEGDEFKVRQGLSWDVSFGKDNGNYVVSADEAGSKKIQLVTTVDADGKVTGGTISLIAA